jgi:hypothetical protein
MSTKMLVLESVAVLKYQSNDKALSKRYCDPRPKVGFACRYQGRYASRIHCRCVLFCAANVRLPCCSLDADEFAKWRMFGVRSSWPGPVRKETRRRRRDYTVGEEDEAGETRWWGTHTAGTVPCALVRLLPCCCQNPKIDWRVTLLPFCFFFFLVTFLYCVVRSCDSMRLRFLSCSFLLLAACDGRFFYTRFCQN